MSENEPYRLTATFLPRNSPGLAIPARPTKRLSKRSVVTMVIFIAAPAAKARSMSVIVPDAAAAVPETTVCAVITPLVT